MSSITVVGSVPTIRRISSSASRNDGGDHESSFSDQRRTAASPSARTSAMIPATISVTLAESALGVLVGWAAFNT
jgi:hypothetical protein